MSGAGAGVESSSRVGLYSPDGDPGQFYTHVIAWFNKVFKTTRSVEHGERLLAVGPQLKAAGAKEMTAYNDLTAAAFLESNYNGSQFNFVVFDKNNPESKQTFWLNRTVSGGEFKKFLSQYCDILRAVFFRDYLKKTLYDFELTPGLGKMSGSITFRCEHSVINIVIKIDDTFFEEKDGSIRFKIGKLVDQYYQENKRRRIFVKSTTMCAITIEAVKFSDAVVNLHHRDKEGFIPYAYSHTAFEQWAKTCDELSRDLMDPMTRQQDVVIIPLLDYLASFPDETSRQLAKSKLCPQEPGYNLAPTEEAVSNDPPTVFADQEPSAPEASEGSATGTGSSTSNARAAHAFGRTVLAASSAHGPITDHSENSVSEMSFDASCTASDDEDDVSFVPTLPTLKEESTPKW